MYIVWLPRGKEEKGRKQEKSSYHELLFPVSEGRKEGRKRRKRRKEGREGRKEGREGKGRKEGRREGRKGGRGKEGKGRKEDESSYHEHLFPSFSFFLDISVLLSLLYLPFPPYLLFLPYLP